MTVINTSHYLLSSPEKEAMPLGTAQSPAKRSKCLGETERLDAILHPCFPHGVHGQARGRVNGNVCSPALILPDLYQSQAISGTVVDFPMWIAS